MKDLKAIKGKYYIARLIAEGEHEHQDFKFAISDARKIARSLSAFANNDGGRLLVGVKDNGNIAGVRNEEDIYVIEQAAEMYCDPPQTLEFTVYLTEGGLRVLKAEISAAERRPVSVIEEGGRRRAYYRVKDENIVADPLMVRGWRRRWADSSQGSVIALDGTPRRLLDFLADGQATLDEFVTTAHVSRSGAEEAAVTLHALDLINFVYDGHRFKLELND